MSEPLFLSREQQQQKTRKELDHKKKEVGSWIPGRHDLRLNLDALQADRREKQIEAALESAKNASDFTLALPKDEREDVEFTLRSNTLRLLEQIKSTNHTAGALDRFLSKWIHGKKKEEEKRGYVLPDASEASVGRKVAEFFLNDPQAAEIFGATGLGSDKVSDADKAMLLRNMQELFKALGRNKEDLKAFDGLRAKIVQDVVKALPNLSPQLQDMALQSIAELKQYYSGKSDYAPDADRYSQAQFLEAMKPNVFAQLDEEAKIQYIRKAPMDSYTGMLLMNLLKGEKSRAVMEEAIKAIARFDTSGPDGNHVVHVDHAVQTWGSVERHKAGELLVFYNKQIFEAVMALPIAQSMGFEALKILEGRVDQTGRSFPDMLENVIDPYDYHYSADGVGASFYLALPGFYLDKFRNEKIAYKKQGIADDLVRVQKMVFNKIANISERNLTQNLPLIEQMVTALESGKRAFAEMKGVRNLRQMFDTYTWNGVARKFDNAGRRGKAIANRMNKLLS